MGIAMSDGGEKEEKKRIRTKIARFDKMYL